MTLAKNHFAANAPIVDSHSVTPIPPRARMHISFLVEMLESIETLAEGPSLGAIRKHIQLACEEGRRIQRSGY